VAGPELGRRTASLRLVAAALLAGYLAAAQAVSARPQMFSVLLFAVEVYLLEGPGHVPVSPWRFRC
jgi:hypothetical protein